MSNKININNTLKPFNKTLEIEGDKSLSIRWALLASQSYAKSKSQNLLLSEDVINTLNCLKKLGVKNLLIDLPSVDKEKDDGQVENHKLFFDFASGGNSNTLTELVYISDEIIDGDYYLNLQIMPIENDAAPSRPILFKINYL